MKNTNSKYYISFVIASVIAVIAFSFWQYNRSNTIPILSEKIGEENGKVIYKGFESFTGFDQHGTAFNLSDLEGKVHVANFFFCSCPVVCPKMTMETKKVADAIGERDDFILVSFSIDPKRDTATTLLKFANKFEANKSNWHFLNIGKENVFKLARNSYKITAVDGNAVSNDFIHSELITLVDKEMRIRGYYDSTEPEEIEKLIKHINKLL